MKRARLGAGKRLVPARDRLGLLVAALFTGPAALPALAAGALHASDAAPPALRLADRLAAWAERPAGALVAMGAAAAAAPASRHVPADADAQSLPPLRLSMQLTPVRVTAAVESSRTPATRPGAGLQMLLGQAHARPAPAGEPLLLADVVVNGSPLRTLAPVQRAEGGLLLGAQAWAEARFISRPPRRLPDGTEAFALHELPGVRWRLDGARLSLEIEADPSAFQLTVLDAHRPVPLPQRPPNGVVLNYDLNLEHAESSYGGAVLEAIAFGPAGNFTSSGLWSHGLARDGFERLDTAWRYERPESMQTVVVGDAIGVGGAWSRPVRYGGVRWARNFALRPGFVTQPQVEISGQAAVPSAVEVLVNDSKRLAQRIEPGPFRIPYVPVVTGAGELSVVVRDLLGREQVITQDYYASTSLLARDLLDYSFEAGWLRTGYGHESRYSDAFAAATVRRGLTDGVTGEARMELQRDRQAGGIELAGAVGALAVAHAALATSQGRQQGRPEQGLHWVLGLERSTRGGGGFLRYEGAQRGFAPFGETIDAAAPGERTRKLLQAGASVALPAGVAVGASVIEQARWSGERFRLGALTVSAPVGDRAVLMVTTSKRIGNGGGWDAMLSLAVPLDNGVFATARATHARESGNSAAVSASYMTPSRRGLDWRVEAATTAGQLGSAGAAYNTDSAEVGAELALAGSDRVAARGYARGALGLLAGVPFATRALTQDRSFAIVDTQGVPGVPVRHGHRVVSVTDAQGIAVVPELLPWQSNALVIDPADVPLDVEVEQRALLRELVPYARSGHLISFPLRRVRQALLVLHDPQGNPLQQSARVQVGGREAVSGRRGEVWVEHLPAEGPVRLTWADGACDRMLPLPARTGDGQPPVIGPVPCKE